jgi:NAD(P)-dependent dehydrogenase (short-subunit alcohol dehydrogenase family)
MGRVEGKVALVFGAGSSGPGWSNGKAAAVTYAREGAAVVAVDRAADAADETAAIIRGEGYQALAVAADVTDFAAVARAVEQTVETFGRVDILHNNVGITEMGGPIDLEEERWQRSLDINLGSVYRTAKAVLPHMLKQRSGVIINISSLASIRWAGYPYFAYYASKAAVNQATVALALQYADQGIRANAILPVEARNRMVPTGKMGTAWDIAHAAVFLASDQASFINGVCLPVDGGQSCGIGSFGPK